MKQRRRLTRSMPGKKPVLAALTSVALAAAAVFGGSQIVHVQSIGGANVSVDMASASLSSGENITVDDAAVMTQGGEQNEQRVVKEFTRDTPFSLVGLTWEGERDIVAYVRSQREDGSWSQWYQMDPAGNEDSAESGAKQGTDPIYVEKTTRIQVSTGNVDLLGGERTDSEAPVTADDIEAVFLDGGEGTVDGGISQVADSYAFGMPKVVSRASWGATRSPSPDYTEPTKAITVHHTAGSNNYSAAEAPGIVRSIQAYHQGLGWGDIGYNALVDKYGTIYEGRAGGLDRGPMGAHVGSYNSNTWGISMLGNYDQVQPTAEGLKALGDMIGWKAAQAGIDPKGTTQLTAGGNYAGSRFSAGQTATFPTINAHRDFHYTTCPGQYLYSQMGAVRDAANAKYQQLRGINSADTANSAQSEQSGQSTQQQGSVTAPNGTSTSVKSSDATSLARVSLEKLASGDPQAVANAAGTLAGVVIVFLLQSGAVQQSVTRIGETELIPGLTLSSLTPYIGEILKFVGGGQAADAWKQLEPTLGALKGAASGIGGTDYAFYSNGIGVRTSQGDVFSLVGDIANAWLQQGLDAGPLGLPVSNSYNPSEDEVKVDFQGGSITYTPSSHAVTIDLSSAR